MKYLTIVLESTDALEQAVATCRQSRPDLYLDAVYFGSLGIVARVSCEDDVKFLKGLPGVLACFLRKDYESGQSNQGQDPLPSCTGCAPTAT